MIDWAIMAAYVSGLVCITVLLKKKASKGMDEYYLGGRKLPWWMLGMSGMAQQLDMTGTMLMVSLIFALGMRGIYVEIRGGLILLMAFAMVFHGKWNRRSGCMTNAEWKEFRFGSGKAGQLARTIGALSVIVMAVGALAVFMKGSGIFLAMFFPYSPLTCSLALFLIATVYTILSGFYGVVFTDLFQSGFILLGTIVVAVMGFRMVPDSAGFAEAAVQVTNNPFWRSLTLPMHVEMPGMYKMFESFLLTIIYSFMFISFLGVSRSGARNIYFAAKNDRECGTLSFLWIVTSAVRWFLLTGLVILGVYLIKDMFPDVDVISQAAALIKEHFPSVSAHSWGETIAHLANNPSLHCPELVEKLHALFGDNWPEKIKMASYYGSINPEKIMPAVLYYSIPYGLKGLIFVTLMAAAMSTFDSKLNETAAYFVRDIYQRHLRPDAGEKELVRVSRWTCVGIVLASVFLGFFARSINEIWNWVMVGLSGGIAMPALLGWYWWRFNGVGFAAGTFVGMGAAVLQRIVAPDLPTIVSFPIVLLISLAGSLIGTFCSQPPDRDVLKRFFEKTRPFGFWNPVRKHCDLRIVQLARNENRNDIIAVFFALAFQFLIYWVPVQFMLKEWARFWMSSALFLISGAGLYCFWYRWLPRTNSVDENGVTK
jgi:solute:Na+ symporter, SSS family